MSQSPHDRPPVAPAPPPAACPPHPGAAYPPPQTRYAAPAPVSPADARTMSLVAHLGGILVGVVVPLVVFLVYKDRDRFVRAHAAEALNFQITLALAYLVSMVTMIVGVGFVLFLAAWVCSIVFAVLGSIAANAGRPYRYPVSLRPVS